MTANPLELRGRHLVNNMNPEVALEADGWGNVMAEACTGNHPGQSTHFLGHIDHDWLVKMLEERIADWSLIRMIRKWLKAGVMEELNHWSPSDEGTPQGGVISPLLGNIYLHFVQDLWIKKMMANPVATRH